MKYDLNKMPPGARAALNRTLMQHGARLNVPSGIMGSVAAQVDLPHNGDDVPFSTGLLPSDDDVQDYPLVWSGKPPMAEMDYRSECSPIKNQGQAGACTAFEQVAHCERLAKRGGAVPGAYDFAERANYNMSRALLGFTGDSGATLRAAAHAAYKYGLPLESEFPYNDTPAVINDLTIPEDVLHSASRNKVDAYYRIDKSLTNESAINRRIDCALADGMTVGVGMWVMRWIFYVTGPLSTHAAVRNNPVPWLLAPGQNWSDIVGGHALTIVGRSETLGGYIVRNSWDTTWGDGGYYLMPFADTSMAFEFWAFKGFAGSDVLTPTYDINCLEAQAARLYTAALGRYPDVAGLAYQTDAVAHLGLTQVARNFMASPEFAARYGAAPSDSSFVTLLYRNALRRDPDADGFRYQLNALANGMERAQLLVNFSESPENRNMP